MPRAVKFDFLVVLVELGLIPSFIVALLGRLLLAVLVVSHSSRTGEIVAFAEVLKHALTLRADLSVIIHVFSDGELREIRIPGLHVVDVLPAQRRDLSDMNPAVVAYGGADAL